MVTSTPVADKSRHGEIAELWWAIDDHDVVTSLTSASAGRDAKKNRTGLAAALGEDAGSLLLEFGELDIAGNDIETGKICLPNDRR